jgi:hypothetical protein
LGFPIFDLRTDVLGKLFENVVALGLGEIAFDGFQISIDKFHRTPPTG